MAINAAFFDAVRSSLFGGTLLPAQVTALEAISDAWARYGDGDPAKLAYVLATAFHETARFKFMREVWGPTAAQKRYEGRADLGNTVVGDGKKFLGRGFVQVTGRRNYSDWSRRLGIDLLKEPQLAEQPAIAARILVEGMMLGTFTGRKLSDYETAAGPDYRNARRIVNGLDRADDIAGYARSFAAALAKAGEPVPKPSPPAEAKPPPVTTPVALRGIPTAVIILIIALAAAGAFFFLR